MALLKEQEKYHQMSPTDVSMSSDKKPVATIDVARTTNHTGEQFHVAVPVYADDTRDQVNDRLQFFLSIIQDRLEQENKAIVAQNEKAQKVRHIQESVRRNGIHFKKQLEALQKRARKEKWPEAQLISEREKLLKALKESNDKLLGALSPEEKEGIVDETTEETSGVKEMKAEIQPVQ